LDANDQRSLARQRQIGHTEQRKKLRLILCQPPSAGLPEPGEVLDHMEGMFDLGANACFEFLGLFAELAELAELAARQALR